MTVRSTLAAALALAMMLSACSDTGPEPAAVTPESTSTTRPGSTASPTGCVGALTGPDTHLYRTDVADDEPDLVSLDVYRKPGATGCPAIVWVHGGGWTVGDKAGKAIDTKVAFAGELGAVLVAVNYRLVTPDGDIQWPVMGQDVAAGVAWVADHAAELGIDPAHIALLGHSSGAHLVSIVATNPTLLDDAGTSREQVRCVVALDSAAYEITPAEASRRPLFAGAFGNDPSTLADASPTAQARAHPTGLPDFLIVTRGSPTRIAESNTFGATVESGGADGQVIDAGGYTHEQVNTQLGISSEDVITPPTRAFLRSCFE